MSKVDVLTPCCAGMVVAPKKSSAVRICVDLKPLNQTKPVSLAHHDPDAPTKISADASSYGIGAVLLQMSQSQWRPTAYASRSITATKCRYAKEVLATTWACEKFSDYIFGKLMVIETAHKPLVPLLGTKSLNSLPPKHLYIANTLSREPVSSPTQSDTVLEELAEMAATGYINHLPASPTTLDQDQLCATVKGYCRNGWPAMKPYWEKRRTD